MQVRHQIRPLRMLAALFKWFFIAIAIFGISFLVAAYFFIVELDKELPDIEQLEHVQYQMPLSVYSRDGLLIGQFGEKRRIPVPIGEIPKQQLNAFLAAEDERFFTHPGVDYKGLLRAANHLLKTGKKSQGGSTITMQVVRNFLISKEKTYLRKLKEILLALKLERRFSKNEIFELYLNKIYLGQRAYGLAAAAQTYYGKSLSELSLPQQAMLAGLPKAPSLYNPIVNVERATERRNYVLKRMLDLNFISAGQFRQALASKDDAAIQPTVIEFDAPYVAEMARQELLEKYGDDAYTLGLKAYVTVSSGLQQAADNAVRTGLHLYDDRYGYRGLPHKKLAKQSALKSLPAFGDCRQAVVSALSESGFVAMAADGAELMVAWEQVPWRRAEVERFRSKPWQGFFIQPGDIVWLRQLEDGRWALSQIPAAEAALAAVDPFSGAIQAISGGFDFYRSRYNRATQSKRQPGSGFKPFIYAAALEKGFTPASIINDAPIVIADPSQANDWRPENYTRRFLGPTPLRVALRQSINLVSIRLLQDIGIPYALEVAMRFGFEKEQLPGTLSLALGSGYASPLKMAQAYSVFANGGYAVKPYLIERIDDYSGKVVFQANPAGVCRHCSEGLESANSARRVVSPQVNFLMNSLLRDVVERGTATTAKQLGRSDLAGKTGTTNDQRDAWFNGYTQDFAVSVWLGFDNSNSLGRGETGGKAAIPIWMEFMRKALKDKPEMPLVAPDGIVQAYVNPEDGLLLDKSNKNGLWEFFAEETAPKSYSMPKPPEFEWDENAEGLQEALF
ncbi:penicillin-binding protein 1A [Methylomonas rhizoryzae]|uniref:penicillin-binding protein 1A n=1 Tax=Methylomonas rhizoryzae TaxID=2608981 RepID=UPI0012328AB6|nr:penicillin-binding protein 1A [Methylomonas rhizoryzae]